MLQLLGKPQTIDSDGTLLPPMPSKAFLLLAYLALAPDCRVARPAAAELFWGRVPASKAQANLRQLIRQIRKYAECHRMPLIEADKSDVWLSPDAKIDLLELPARLVSLQPDAAMALLAPGTRILLKDVFVESESGQDWLDTSRANLLTKIVSAVRDAATAWPHDERARVLSQVLSVEPYDETIFADYVMALSGAGRKTRIAIEWEQFKRLLRKDLGVAPDEKTRALVEAQFEIDARAVPAAAGASRPEAGAPVQVSNRPRLMVLPPPEDQSTASQTEHRLARSFVEDIIDGLATLRSFEVIAPYTARRVAAEGPGTQAPVPLVDYELSTRLMGRNSGDDPRMLVIRLVEQASGRIMFSDMIGLDVELLPKRYRDMLAAATRHVVSEIEQAELANFRVSGDAGAYTYFLLAKDRLQPHDLRSVRANRKAFQRALTFDPGFLPARAMLSRTLTQEWFLLARQDPEMLQEAERLAGQVITEAPMSAGGYWELSHARLYRGDIDGAIEHAGTARQLAPHHADVMASHADALVHACDFRQASQEIDRAFELNPLAPDEYHWIKASSLFFSGKSEQALEALRIAENWQAAARLRAACHAQLGQNANAKFWRERYMQEYPDFRVENWTDVVPMKSPEYRDFYIDALRKAGFD